MLSLLISTREKAGLTQQQVAEALGETQSFVSKCERGQRRLDLVEVRMWCGVLGASFSAFAQELDALSALTGKPR